MLILLSSLAVFALAAGSAFSQGTQKGTKFSLPSEIGTLSEEDRSPAAQKYREKVELLRAAIKEARHEMVRFHTEQLREPRWSRIQLWSDITAKSYAAKQETMAAAMELYQSNPANYAKIGEMLFLLLKNESEGDRFEGLSEIAKALIDQRYPDPSLFRLASQAALAENRYDLAIDFIKQDSSQSVEQKNVGISLINELFEKWKIEEAMREKERQADDLPRVELMTSKGRIVLELFENEAPLAVNAFVYLTERGFYDDKSFFRVLEHFVLQAGCERGDGTGSAGFTIRGEMGNPNARRHFRGSVGIALGSDERTKKIDVNSGSAQFYITQLPQPHMDGNFCVFGRVIEGMDRLGEIKRSDPSAKDEKSKTPADAPDVIVWAKVLRKRDHVYQVTPLTGQVDF